MEELERRLREKGCIRCYLMVKDNPEAIPFYEKRHGSRWIYIYMAKTWIEL
jgi:ribosomal protein S18 acetylase RimI-like enzyme